jgi:hypothetical protein
MQGPPGPPGPSGGADNFLALTDTLPNSYGGIKGGFPVVAEDESGLVNTAPVLAYNGISNFAYKPDQDNFVSLTLDAQRGAPRTGDIEIIVQDFGDAQIDVSSADGVVFGNVTSSSILGKSSISVDSHGTVPATFNNFFSASTDATSVRVFMYPLPTVDSGQRGEVWLDNGTLRISGAPPMNFELMLQTMQELSERVRALEARLA